MVYKINVDISQGKKNDYVNKDIVVDKETYLHYKNHLTISEIQACFSQNILDQYGIYYFATNLKVVPINN